MAGILVYSENSKLTLELASAGKELAKAKNEEVYAIAVSQQQATELGDHGLTAYYLNNSDLPVTDVAIMASVIKQAAEQLETGTILLSSNKRGKELAGRLSEAWGAGCLTDVKEIQIEDSRDIFIRNTLGGATVASQVIISPRRVVAFMPKSFKSYAGEEKGHVKSLNIDVPNPFVKVLETRIKSGDNVDIQAAERMVVVGQGLENQNNLEFVDNIAKSLGAVIGCSKPVSTDKKWLPQERVVGLSGKICKPALALILGVSGQVQFAVGIREAQLIISINNDENATIHKMSDYSLIADLKQVIPELENALK